MVINVQFQNISQANAEILKAFNSANSAKALEAYQPLDAKQRKLEKLRALQQLKQSSGSQTLADIALTTSTLSVALEKAEGATLQAMLNLLSAKMIEQNKYTYIESDEEKQIDLKKKVQERLDQRQEQESQSDEDTEEEQDKEDTALEKLIDAAVVYFEELRDSMIASYKKTMDAVSLDNIKRLFAEGIRELVKYAYEIPLQSFKEFVDELPRNFKKSSAFSPSEIKLLLKDSSSAKLTAPVNNPRLKSSVKDMNSSILVKRKLLAKRKAKANIKAASQLRVSSKDIKLALHR